MIANKLLRLLLPVLVILSIVSCRSTADAPIATLIPNEKIPTIIAMTVEAQEMKPTAERIKTEVASIETMPTSTHEPTIQIIHTATPTRMPPTPTRTPSPLKPTQYFPPPENVPPSNLQILSPGQGSAVVSPFSLKASIKLSTEAVVHVELLGEDGRLLMREVHNIQPSESEWTSIKSEVTYGTNAAAESGRLQISLFDKDSRLEELSSVDLILLSLGSSDLHPPPDQLENIVLESPRENTLIQGGTLRVSGLARPRSDQPLMIEIQTSDGRIVGTRQIAVTPSPGSMYGNFAIDVPYHVESTNRVRLKVWEPGSIIPGIVDLASLEVILSP